MTFDPATAARQSALARQIAKAPENLDRFWRTAPADRELDVDTTGLETWIDDTNPFAVLRGAVGTGKTVLACHAAAEMIRRTGRSGIVVYEADMRGFNWELPDDAIVVLDDLGNLTGQAVLENVQALISKRFALRQRTIVTTNHTVASMVEFYGLNLVDRFKTGVNLEMVGGSRR